MSLPHSYRALRDNSISAMLAAIEIYNKPRIAYRDECFVILLINAWELLFKAVLSRYKQRIYYPKKRNQAHRTLSIGDSLAKVRTYFPSTIDYEPVAKNLELLISYRDNAIHFYNKPGFSVIIYGLAQTSITNYRDLMLGVLGRDIAEEMTISLLPLALGVQPDPIEFLRKNRIEPSKNKIVNDYLQRIWQTTHELEERNLDTSRLLTVFKVSLQSVKKVTSADIVVGLGQEQSIPSGTVVVERRVDPNVSHPLRRKEILECLGTSVHGAKFTSNTFQAVIWYFGVRDKPNLYWKSDKGETTRYSNEVVAWIKRLSRSEIDEAVEHFRIHNRSNKAKT